MQTADVVVIGGGAAGSIAGLFAARTLRAACQGGRVVVLETRKQPGAKIRVSGGGRCNVLPQAAELVDFETRGSPNILRNVLFGWPLKEVRSFFEDELGLALCNEARGKVFPRSGDSRDVVAALQQGMAKAGCELYTQSTVQHITRSEDAAYAYTLTLADGTRWLAKKLVVATGGLSMPRTGSDGHGMSMLRALGHAIVPCAPSLVALTSTLSWSHDLAGISVEAKLTARLHQRSLASATGPLLFTHRGLSGPCALDISRHITLPLALGQPSATQHTISAAFGKEAAEAPCARLWWRNALDGQAHLNVSTLLRRFVARRLADALLAEACIEPQTTVAALKKEARERLLTLLTAAPLEVTGSEGYRTAECTTGGVELSNVLAKSLESRVAPGMYLCGEVLDVTGRLGGFNFLWAWTSGRRAGLAAARARLSAETTSSLELHRAAS